ncbi:HET-domain-containing protein, partial [Stipitochalara longipes BDJ]
RLIELLPGKESDPISCSLRPVNLEDAQPFEALSYVWGDGRSMRSIFCFDHGSISNTKTSTILVTSNCWHALRRLRLEDKTRVLWIDAICINQNREDQGEKSQQVPLMGNLYRKASCVLVYLG